jgi:hypothetical protein
MIMAFSAPVGRLPGRNTAVTSAGQAIEDEQRQITGAAVMVFVKRQRLLAMHRVFGVIPIQHQSRRRLCEASDECQSASKIDHPTASNFDQGFRLIFCVV